MLGKQLTLAGLLLMTTGLAFGQPTPGQLEQTAEFDALSIEGCNRAMLFRVSALSVHDQLDGKTPPSGHRWLALDLSVANHMPADLLFDLDYEEAVLIASLVRQMFLLVNGETVYRSVPELTTLEDNFILPRIGASRSGRVVYPIPESELNSLSLRYYHDQYSPAVLALAGRESLQTTLPGPVAQSIQANDVLSLAVRDSQQVDTWQGQNPPQGMQWLVVDVAGISHWTLQADALALDRDAEVKAKVQLAKAMEYVEARGLLQAVVDGRHGYIREQALGTLPQDPVLLPEAWAGGKAVFPVPRDASRIELVAHYPEFRGQGIDDGIPPTGRFVLLEGDTPPAPETRLSIADRPTPFSLHSATLVEQFGQHQASRGERLLLVQASMQNSSDTGGMMNISSRLSLKGNNGQSLELLGAYQRGPVKLQEPFWLPAGGEPRAFSLVYRAPQDIDQVSLEYRGVSVNTEETVQLQ